MENMTGITREDYSRMVTLGGWNGTDWTWQGVSASEPPAKVCGVSGFRATLRDWMVEQQGGMCVHCGLTLSGTLNFSHIVPRGSARLGWIDGNVSAAHAACNGWNLGSADGNLWPWESLARPDLMPLGWKGEWRRVHLWRHA